MLWITLFLVSCANTTKVTSDFNKQYAFESIKSFSILPAIKSKDLQGISLVDQRVQKALKEELIAKGLSERASDKSTILVSFLVTSKDKTKIRTYNTGLTYGAYSHYRYGGVVWNQQVDVYEYTEGQLIVDFIDPETNHVIWRGIGTRVIYDSDKEKSEEIISESIKAILATVPGWQPPENER
jgi:hypothetical protein